MLEPLETEGLARWPGKRSSETLPAAFIHGLYILCTSLNIILYVIGQANAKRAFVYHLCILSIYISLFPSCSRVPHLLQSLLSKVCDKKDPLVEEHKW